MTCTLNAGAASWIDAGESTREDKARAKALRARLLSRALAGRGLRAEPSALGAGLRLTAQDGRAILSEDMGEVWAWVEDVLGAPFDPLEV
jgi:hypothetical protein